MPGKGHASAKPDAALIEQLGFSAGPLPGPTTSAGLLTPGSAGYLEVSDLKLSVAPLLTLSRPNGGTGNGQLVVARTGAVCNGDFPGSTQHSTLVDFTLNFDGGAITTAGLPDATARSGYVAAVPSTGGEMPLVCRREPRLHRQWRRRRRRQVQRIRGERCDRETDTGGNLDHGLHRPHKVRTRRLPGCRRADPGPVHGQSRPRRIAHPGERHCRKRDPVPGQCGFAYLGFELNFTGP